MATDPRPPRADAPASASETIVTAPGFFIAGRVVTPLTPRSPVAGAA